MKLNHGLHLAYCTNIHRGENWQETFDSLKTHTLAVRRQVCPDKPYAIGLRLGSTAAKELSDPATLQSFRQWLEETNCYVFTINGFPFGRFHGSRVKEQVYRPDWTSRERLDYTNLLFDLLAELVPDGVEGSVSTLPGSFKEFITEPGQEQEIRNNIWACVGHIAEVSRRTGKKLHLGLEPEPLGYFETSAESIRFFEQMRAEHPNDARLAEHLGINYDTCHLAVEFEEPKAAISALQEHGIKISKLHLSSALKVRPTPEVRQALGAFADDIYLHQVIIRKADGTRTVHKDLAPALGSKPGDPQFEEWRIHFHIPLHSPATKLYESTSDHVLGVLDLLQANPKLCSHLEMETYTWEVLPSELKNRNVVDQLVAEYHWTLKHLSERGLANKV
jgi:sugar phosphate isomerase/epimerase